RARCARRGRRRSVGARAECVSRVLEEDRGIESGVYGWMVQDGRYWTAVGGWVLHAVRAQERSDYFGRIQYLSAGDRRVFGRAAGSGGSSGGGREGSVEGGSAGGICGVA